MKKILFFGLLLVFLGPMVLGQGQFSLYQMNSVLPQSNQLNPAIFPDYKVVVGVPGLASTYVSANGGKLSFNNAFVRGVDDSLHLDLSRLASIIDKENAVKVNASAQLFMLGLRIQKNYFSLTLNERVSQGLSIPNTLFQLLATGNGESVGRVLAFDNLDGQVLAYQELAMGYGRQVTEKLNVGVRAKLLFGVASVDMVDAGATLLTTLDSVYLHSNGFNINSSGTSFLDNNSNVNVFDMATNFNNKGFAFDVGGEYKINDQFTVSLSATDLGSINWKDDTEQIQFPRVSYSFTGGNLLDIIDANQNYDYFSAQADSLGGLFEPDTIQGVNYKTKLSPKIYTGVTYQLGKMHTFGALIYGDVFKGKFDPAFGLSYNLQLGRIWNLGVNASYRNGSFANFGLGTTLNLGPIQIYAMTENATGYLNLANASYLDARLGLNIVVGKKKEKEQRKVKEKKKKKEKETPKVIPINTASLSEPVTMVQAGTSADEMSPGFYVVIASFEDRQDSEEYGHQLVDEGYMVKQGYQSERQQFLTYLMYYENEGNKAIDKKNQLSNSFGPGLGKPWVLWVKAE